MSKISQPAADRLSQREKLEIALAKLEEMQTETEIPPRLQIALAEAEFRLAVLPDTPLDETIERLERAITYDPFHPKLFLHLGHCFYQNGDFGAAVNRYRQAIQLVPTSQRVHAHLALCLLELGVEEGRIRG